MTSFLLALQFLTVIPLKIQKLSERDIAYSMIYFPVVGLLLGLVLAGANILLISLGFKQIATDVSAIILLIILTGGLHLDGLSDTADAILSRKNKDEMLKIMRDSRIGVMGALSLISIILLKISFLSSVNLPTKTTALILMCVLSRWSLVFAIFLFPYARSDGKAKVFTQGINSKITYLATAITLLIAVLTLGLRGVLILVVTAMCVYLIGKFVTKKLGGITGDTLGAINELIEITVLFIICLF